MPTKIVLAILIACLTVNPVVSFAAETDAAAANRDIDVYPRAYFEVYNPETAKDMVDRLPGFRFDPGADLRGFAGGGGNVLIDGARPSSKSGGVEEALQRIPADSVDRIEILRGTTGAGETAGHSIIANVIRSNVTGSGRWEAQLERAAHGKANAAIEVTKSIPIGGWDVTGKLDASIERQPLDAERITRNMAGAVTFLELEERPSNYKNIGASLEASRPLAGGELNLNGRFGVDPRTSRTERIGFRGVEPAAIPDERLIIQSRDKFSQAEFSLDWSRPLSDEWSFKVLSLTGFETARENDLVVAQAPIGVELRRSNFSIDQNSLETIFRVISGRNKHHKFRPEFGLEAAFNQLDSSLSLILQDETGETPVVLPAADVAVQEIRGEAFANLIWEVKRRMSVETGLAAELSEISVSGDVSSRQSFFFLKPHIIFNYNWARGVQFRLGARRKVGQLDFSDFAASASASDDRLTAGNPALGPDQTTRLFLAADLQSPSGQAFNLEAFHEWRSDILEQVILPSGGQGVANAGAARVWGVKAVGSLPLTRLVPGGLLEVEAEFLDSSFLDPITGEARVVSSIDSPTILISFRQDLPELRVAWGADYRAASDGLFFFVDEESYNRDGEHWAAFLETTRWLGVKSRLEFSGIGGQDFVRRRVFFDPDRSAAFNGSQTIKRNRGMSVALTVSKQF